MQAGERADLETFLDGAAELIAGAVDLDAITELAERLPAPPPMPRIPPPAQRIAMANDAAFAFSYPHLLEDWRAQGAEILPFSPLADEPVPQTDLVYLPGGYPELHAGRLAAAETFLSSLRAAAQTAMIHGECGGYMVLGDGLVDADGTRHPMAGLLRLETSFADRRLHLGYRHLRANARFAGGWGAGPGRGTGPGTNSIMPRPCGPRAIRCLPPAMPRARTCRRWGCARGRSAALSRT